MKINRKKLSNAIHGANGRSGITGTLQLVEFTLGQLGEMRRLELNWLRKQYGTHGQWGVEEARDL